MAAVLACGEGAFLSHRSAAALWDLAPNQRATIDVSSPTRAGRRHRGVMVHRVWCPDQVEVVEGIPCASVPLALLQLAGVVDRRRLERALERAEVLELFDLYAILELLERAGRRRPGAGRLRRALALNRPEAPVSRTELERRFLGLCRRHDLPLPSFRAWVPVDGEGMEVDFLWRETGLVVETDSRRFHSTTRAFETDRRRDQHLVAAGYKVVRFTWRQITDTPSEVVTTLRSLLVAPAAAAPPTVPAAAAPPTVPAAAAPPTAPAARAPSPPPARV
jgi:very-short-patch-repair endonuclease